MAIEKETESASKGPITQSCKKKNKKLVWFVSFCSVQQRIQNGFKRCRPEGFKMQKKKIISQLWRIQTTFFPPGQKRREGSAELGDEEGLILFDGLEGFSWVGEQWEPWPTSCLSILAIHWLLAFTFTHVWRHRWHSFQCDPTWPMTNSHYNPLLIHTKGNWLTASHMQPGPILVSCLSGLLQ